MQDIKVIIPILLLVIGFPVILVSQNVTISGHVKDANNGENLIGAAVIEVRSGKGTTSNNYGFYSLTVPASDTLLLVYSFVGYQKQYRNIACETNSIVNVSLPSDLTLEEVVVIGERINSFPRRHSEMSLINLSAHDAKQLPAIGGESDMLKVAQLMPGVQSGNEGTSGLYVRGGSHDQNLIMLDDATLYYVNHLGGFVSIFNTDAISNTALFKGGFPARYGNRLSSVFDVRTKDGNSKEHHGNVMIGMVTSKIAIEGPIKIDTSSYFISCRRFMYDLLMRPLSRIVFDGITESYSFYDLNAKLNYRISDKDALFFSVYSGHDRISSASEDENSMGTSASQFAKSWGNQLVALRWNHVINPRLFTNSVVSYTRYHYQTELDNETKTSLYNELLADHYLSTTNDMSFKADMEFYPSSRYKFRFGISSVFHDFEPNKNSYKLRINDIVTADTVYGNYTLRAFDNAAYVENELRLAEKLSINAGVRLSNYAIDDTSFFNLEPRLLVSWQLAKDVFLKASYSEMSQSVHLLTNSGSGMPTDLWLPATKNIAPEKSTQYAVGVSTTQDIMSQTFDFSLELYYKKMNNLIAYKAGSSIYNSTRDWQEMIEKNGNGISEGIELLAKKVSGNTTGWIGCTFSKTTRQFENINHGEPFLYKYDRPVDISVAIIHKFTNNINCSFTWVYGTGNAVSIPAGAYSALSDDGWETVYIYNGINTYRMKSYHRLDIGLNFEKEKKHGTRIWNVSVYNAYNRMNPYYYYFKTNSQTNEVKLMQVTMFPIMPSVSYEFRF